MSFLYNNFLTFFLSAESKKEQIALNLPENKFHKKLRKVSSQNFVTSSQNDVRKYGTNGHEQVFL